MSSLPDVQHAVRDLHRVARARVRWPEAHGPAFLDVTFVPTADNAAGTREVLAVLGDVAGVDLGTIEVGPLPAAGERRVRPVLVGVSVDQGPLDTAVEVALRHAGRTSRGRSDDVTTPEATVRAAARATLVAVAEVLPDDVRVTLEWLEVRGVPGVDRRASVEVAVGVLREDGQDLFLGAALVRGDVRESAARATLDALNRPLDRIAAAAAA